MKLGYSGDVLQMDKHTDFSIEDVVQNIWEPWQLRYLIFIICGHV
jgi:hypothetical protein